MVPSSLSSGLYPSRSLPLFALLLCCRAPLGCTLRPLRPCCTTPAYLHNNLHRMFILHLVPGFCCTLLAPAYSTSAESATSSVDCRGDPEQRLPVTHGLRREEPRRERESCPSKQGTDTKRFGFFGVFFIFFIYSNTTLGVNIKTVFSLIFNCKRSLQSVLSWPTIQFNNCGRFLPREIIHRPSELRCLIHSLSLPPFLPIQLRETSQDGGKLVSVQ